MAQGLEFGRCRGLCASDLLPRHLLHGGRWHLFTFGCIITGRQYRGRTAGSPGGCMGIANPKTSVGTFGWSGGW